MGLLLSTVAAASLTAGAAFAQGAATAPTSELEEVVVTATRQADTVNRVAIAVTAQTQEMLTQQGVRSVRDLQSLVPSLNTNQSLGSGAAQFSIRGVGFLGSNLNNTAGAAPVGFYLDESPLHKRNVGGGVATANGTPLPPLFDLERVEVLRGPQGTLFGGGSEGGTIRYIQPAPSLTTYSTYMRAEYSTPKKGDDSYEGGFAVGGPLVQDKLGFRASVYARKTGGFIDRIDPLTGQEWAHNSGGEQTIRMMRGAIAWAPTERSRVTLDFFSSQDKTKDVATTYTPDLPNAVNVPTLCFNTNNTPAGLSGFDANGLGINSAARRGAVSAIPANPAGAVKINPNPVGRGDAACNTLQARGDVTHRIAGFTYGPYDLDRYDSVSSALSPTKTNLQVLSLTLDYDFGNMTAKSITTYIDDQTKTLSAQTTPQGGLRSNSYYDDPVLGRQFIPNGPAFHPVLGASSVDVNGWFNSNNRRYGLVQELRFASAGEGKRFTWVAGVYYANIRGKAGYDNYQPLDFFSQKLYGLSTVARYGVNGIETAPGLFNNFDLKRQSLKDVEMAGYGEANFWLIPDRLRLTAGVRVSRVTFEYDQVFLGPVTSVGPENTSVRQVNANTVIRFDQPSPQNGGTNAGSVSESPITPKFGVQYQLTSNKMLYLTAAKGFRAGGVNSQVSYGICQIGLDQFGYLPEDLQSEYKSDSVWAYEAGAKMRMLQNRLQVNTSVYRIDWKDAQFTTPPPQCGLVTTFNVPSARSEGVEIEATARVFRGFTVNSAFAYTNSRYTDGLTLPGRPAPQNNFNPINFNVVVEGQKIPVPEYTFNIGGRYEFNFGGDKLAYIRGDYRYTSGFPVAPFPAASYTPDSINEKIEVVYLRAGIQYRNFDVNVFVNNAFDRKTGSYGGGRANCRTLECGPGSYSGYNPVRTLNTGYPREIGVQISYRN
jgi:outer membrane receptor protein involved in Fe transport